MLLCAPSLGVLDNWLPVLHAAREARRTGSGWRIIALIPEPAILTQLDPSDTAHRLADELLDATVAPLVGGGWVVAPGFLRAADIARPTAMAERLPRPLRRLARTRTQRAALIDASVLDAADNRLLYDLELHEKQRIAPLLASFGRTPRWSHHHGIELEEVGERSVRLEPSGLAHAAFLYGKSEIEAYATNYGLDRSVLHPVGVARHEPDWVRSIVERSSALHALPFDRFVFVVSRPAGSPYLPRERKVAALRALHTVAWEVHGLPLVLRTHPKEHEDGTLAEALPASGEGISWSRSRAHPFHLATRSELAVTFFSGVAVDLVALGVPVVELLDVRGIAAYDGPDAPRDARGRPRFGPYRRDGLVIPADDADDLRAVFARIAEDRDGTLSGLRAAMDDRFTDPRGAALRMLGLLSA